MRRLTPLLLLALALPLAGCASGPPGTPLGDSLSGDWDEIAEETDPALSRGATLVTWTRGRGLSRERRRAVRRDGHDYEIATFGDLDEHVRPVADSHAAVAHLRLAHRLGLVPGQPLVCDRSGRGPGGNGVFTPVDAARWEVPLEPTVTPYAGGFRVVHLVVIAPQAHPDIPRKTSPWRVVLLDAVVSPDGGVDLLDSRSLLSGDAAARYASL